VIYLQDSCLIWGVWKHCNHPARVSVWVYLCWLHLQKSATTCILTEIVFFENERNLQNLEIEGWRKLELFIYFSGIFFYNFVSTHSRRRRSNLSASCLLFLNFWHSFLGFVFTILLCFNGFISFFFNLQLPQVELFSMFLIFYLVSRVLVPHPLG